MPRGDKSAYTQKQKRQAEHIEEGYEERGIPEEEAERRAWATVNKMSSGGKLRGSGRGHPERHESAPMRGGERGGAASAARSPEERSASARKAAETRKRHEAERHG